MHSWRNLIALLLSVALSCACADVRELVRPLPPLSAEEAIPWSGDRLLIGTGASGALPIAPEVFDEARRRGVEIVAVPTAEACELITAAEAPLTAILHVTC